MWLFKKKTNENDSQIVESQNAITANVSEYQMFGRYTDCNKNSHQLDAFDKSMNLFKEKSFLASFVQFFEYIKDSEQENVWYKADNTTIEFEIIHGSKVLKGIANENNIKAEIKIVGYTSKLNVAIMRKLMMLNYNLKYCMFAINDSEVVIRFSSDTTVASPYKLYSSFKEMASTADKQDDLLISEFKELIALDTNQIYEIPDTEKETKYKYLIHWIKIASERIKPLDEVKYSGPISFILLSLAYKIDYFLKPEGVLNNSLERIQSIYSRNDLEIVAKNYEMLKEFEKILEMSKESQLSCMYKTKSTFSILVPVNFKQVADFIYEETQKVGNYLQRNEKDTVKDIYEFTAGYCLFYWGMPKPLKELLALYLHISNSSFISELGIHKIYMDAEIPKKAVVEKEIKAIIDRGKKEYPKLAFNSQGLNYQSLIDFAGSFFKEIDYLNFTK